MVNSTSIGYIYGLYSTNNNEIKYIGYSVEPIIRFKKHIRESKKLMYYRHKWIQSELVKGYEIKMIILKTCKEEDLGKYEIEEIKFYKKLGNKLTNGNDGGVGGINPTKEVREKLRISKLGNKYSLGVTRSEEYKQNASKRLKGVPKSEETKRKVSEGLKRYYEEKKNGKQR